MPSISPPCPALASCFPTEIASSWQCDHFTCIMCRWCPQGPPNCHCPWVLYVMIKDKILISKGSNQKGGRERKTPGLFHSVKEPDHRQQATKHYWWQAGREEMMLWVRERDWRTEENRPPFPFILLCAAIFKARTYFFLVGKGIRLMALLPMAEKPFQCLSLH